MFAHHLSSVASSAPIERIFILIMLRTSVSGMPSNACPFPGTTKNYILKVFLCSITTIHIPNSVIMVLLYVLIVNYCF